MRPSTATGSKPFQYLAALLTIGSLALLYEWIIVPILEPQPTQTTPFKTSWTATQDTTLFPIFPEGSWQREAPKRLKTDNGILLFREREQIAADQWRVWPVSVVFGGLTGPRVVMNAEKGAEVTFSGPLDVLSSGAPSIERGRLRGQVSIKTYPGQDGVPVPSSEQLEISATDVGIDRKRIWTHNKIRLQRGRMIAAGRNLTLYLAGGGVIPTKSNQPPISNLDRMELIYLDELNIPLASDGMGGPAGDVSIHCEGSCVFDFATDELRLQDQIKIEHRVTGQDPGTLQADAVSIVLNNPLNDQDDRESIEDWLQYIEISGESVKAHFPSWEFDAVAQHVSYDTNNRQFVMKGTNGVRVIYKGMDLRTANIAYTIPETGPDKLGTLNTSNGGLISFAKTTGAFVRSIRWTGGLAIRPSNSPDKHLLSVDDNVLVQLIDTGKLAANQFRLWFRQGSKSDAFGGLVPESASANGNVNIKTSHLLANTELFKIFFKVKPSPTDSQSNNTPRLTTAEGPRQKFWISSPKPPSSRTHPVAGPTPELKGDTIAAEVALTGNQIVGGDLSVTGNVSMKHQLMSAQGPLPVKATGNYLRVIENYGKDGIYIHGENPPAMLSIGDGHLRGKKIEANTKLNYVQVEGKGDCLFPTKMLPKENPDSGLRWIQPPQCRWNGGLLFDGQSIEISKHVQVIAKTLLGEDQNPWNLNAAGEHLRIDLTKRVWLRKPNDFQQTSIQSLALTSPKTRQVDLTAEEMDTVGNLKARHHLLTSYLRMTPETGKLDGGGPGSYRQWSVAAADGPLTRFVEPEGLLGIHLVFEHNLEANLPLRNLVIGGRVRIGAKPIESWETFFDARKMVGVQSGQALLDCEQLDLAAPLPQNTRTTNPVSQQSPAPNFLSTLVVTAREHVRARARSENEQIEISADRASYAAGRDQLKIHGTRAKPAIYRHIPNNGTSIKTLTLSYLAMKLRTMIIEDAEFIGAQTGKLSNQRFGR